VAILHPKGRVSPIQEAQMTACIDANVYNLAVHGTFDDCQVNNSPSLGIADYILTVAQDIVKTLFGDPETNKDLKLGAVNSINFSRILAQIVYYFKSYFALAKQSETFKVGDTVRFVVPTGNFVSCSPPFCQNQPVLTRTSQGDILAGYFAVRMGLPADRLVIATNENDILDRFWKTGRYEKHVVPAQEAEGGLEVDGVKAHADGVKETLSPAMDILVSSNFERLLWFLAYEFAATVGMDDEFNMKHAGQEVNAWLRDLKVKGGFGPVYKDVLSSARRTFESERVSDEQTVETMKQFYDAVGYVLDPHTAVGVTAAVRSIKRADDGMPHISLSTAHPAKFAGAVELALKDNDKFSFDKVLPEEFVALEKKPRRVADVENDWKAVRDLVRRQVEKELSS